MFKDLLLNSGIYIYIYVNKFSEMCELSPTKHMEQLIVLLNNWLFCQLGQKKLVEA